MKTLDDKVDHLPTWNVSITIVVIHCHISFIFVCHFVFETFFVVLYYKIFNCVISFVNISFH